MHQGTNKEKSLLSKIQAMRLTQPWWVRSKEPHGEKTRR